MFGKDDIGGEGHLGDILPLETTPLFIKLVINAQRGTFLALAKT